MKYHAIHDATGKISTIIGSPVEGRQARPAKLEPGQQLSELTLPEGVVNPDDPANLQTLLDIAANFRVDAAPTPTAHVYRAE